MNQDGWIKMVTTEEIKKAVGFFKLKKGTVQQKIDYLMRKRGFTYIECLEAMNEAGDNALLKSAGVY